MTALNGAPYQHPTLLWCDQCGMLVVDRPQTTIEQNVTDSARETIWFEPKSVENTKKLVQRMLKAEARASASISHANRMAKDEMDRVDWGEDDRR
jgi:hypothetical protein